ncbi:MAG: metallophosphoesterase family protein [Chloroflexota bacterium]|jgi:acid phosphatase type 7
MVTKIALLRTRRGPARWLVAATSALALAVALPLPVAAADPVLVGAGDIASCSSTGDSATAKLIAAVPGTVFTAGDNAYDQGTPWQYANCYGPTWGQARARTRPAAGNHEYVTAGAAGYFGYFGSRAGDPRRGYYAYNLGAWRIYVLNSNCAAVGGCGAGSPQETWLRHDLAANPRRCSLAYWHHPLYSSGEHGNNSFVRAFWSDLQAAHAELVVNGHDHDYERFRRMTPSGAVSSLGIREFVVGTGGRSHYPFGTIKPYSVVRNSTTYGVLKLTLHPTSYDWQFIPQAGRTFTDHGSAACD